MGWIKTGSVTVTNGSATVTGSGTFFVDVGTLNAGDIFCGPDGKLYEILTINSNTGLTLASNYLGTTLAGQAYSIMPIGLLPSTLAQQVKATLTTANNALASTVRYDINSMGLTLTQQQNARTNIAALSSLDVGQGRLSKSVAGGVDVTLTAVEASAQFIELTGTITANINVIVPAAARLFYVYNGTAGAFTVTIKTPSGTGVVVPSAARAMLECDATNVVNPLTQIATGLAVTGALSATGNVSLSNYSKLNLQNGVAATKWSIFDEGVSGNDMLQIDSASVTGALNMTQSGNLGLGVTPSAWSGIVSKVLEFQNGCAIGAQSNVYNLHLLRNAYFDGSGWKYKNSAAAVRFSLNDDAGSGGLSWYIAPSGTAGAAITWNTAMTLDTSGNLLVGQTSSGGANANSFQVATSAGNVFMQHISGSASGNGYISFNYNASGIGSVTQNGTTGVLYNTTSDYRVKNDPVAVIGSGERIDALLPKSWIWNRDKTPGQGFLAHEFAVVYPSSVQGIKDEMQDVTYEISPAVQGTFDDDGNVLIEAVPAVMGTRSVPKYQSMMASSPEVIADIVSEIQSLRARTALLESTLVH